jgi:tRNA-dihydrouridine synthase A
MLGLRNGQPGARRWRQVWSDHHRKAQHPAEVHAAASAARLAPVPAGVSARVSARVSGLGPTLVD